MHNSRTRGRSIFAIAFLLIIAVSVAPLFVKWRAQNAELPIVSTPQTRAALSSREVVVDLRDDVTAQDVAQLQAQIQTSFGARLQPNSPRSQAAKLFRVQVQNSTQRDALIVSLQADARVESVEAQAQFSVPEPVSSPEKSDARPQIAPQSRSKRSFVPNDPRYGEQWNFALIDAPTAWNYSHGKGVIVAVIDTGVALHDKNSGAHGRDFAQTKSVAGYNFVDDSEDTYDDNGHGSHVAGTIAQSTNNREGVAGLAFESSIMPLKVFGAQGGGHDADIADAIRFAADNGAHVINLSLGGPHGSTVLRNAVNYAKRKNVLVVASAGNGFGEPVGFPAAFKASTAVSSVGPKQTMAPYSSFGPQVALAAPGGDMSQGENGGILQNTFIAPEFGGSGDDYYYFQGTSMAAPHVAATAALVMAQGIGDSARVRDILLRSTVAGGERLQFGAGILSAGKATEMAARFNRHAHWKNFAVLSLALLIFLSVRGEFQPRAQLAVAFAAGALMPDYAADYFGYDSLWNLLSFSALLPFLAFWEWEKGHESRLVGAFSAGVAVCLLFALSLDGLSPLTPSFFGVAIWPFVIANTIGATVLAFIALARGKETFR